MIAKFVDSALSIFLRAHRLPLYLLASASHMAILHKRCSKTQFQSRHHELFRMLHLLLLATRARHISPELPLHLRRYLFPQVLSRRLHFRKAWRHQPLMRNRMSRPWLRILVFQRPLLPNLQCHHRSQPSNPKTFQFSRRGALKMH